MAVFYLKCGLRDQLYIDTTVNVFLSFIEHAFTQLSDYNYMIAINNKYLTEGLEFSIDLYEVNYRYVLFRSQPIDV